MKPTEQEKPVRTLDDSELEQVIGGVVEAEAPAAYDGYEPIYSDDP